VAGRNGIDRLQQAVLRVRTDLNGRITFGTDAEIGVVSRTLNELNLKADSLGDHGLRREVRRLQIEAVKRVLKGRFEKV